MKNIIILVVFVLALIPAVMAEGTWADDFDSYPTGISLHGLGGWKGWFNDPNFTAFTTDVQARSTPNSVDIVGNSDLVHEYSNTSGVWCYRFYQYIPGNLVGQTYFIMLNQYDDTGTTNNWSVQVTFDSGTGMITDTGASGATRPYITDQWVETALVIDLDNDTQAYYYNGALFYIGTWSNHVSGGGITAIGAVDLFANGAGSVYYDDMSLTMGDCISPTPTATSPVPTETPPAPTETPPAPTATSPATTETPPAPTETLPAPTATSPATTETPPAPTETPPAPTATTLPPTSTPEVPLISHNYIPILQNSYRHFFEGPWEIEPNNSAEVANGPLISGRDYFGYPNDDRDYFRIYLDTNRSINISLDNHTGGGTQLLLYYLVAGNEVARDFESPFEINYSGPAGLYYIYIFTESGFNSNTPYTIRATFP